MAMDQMDPHLTGIHEEENPIAQDKQEEDMAPYCTPLELWQNAAKRDMETHQFTNEIETDAEFTCH
eukprot:1031068-Pyramimonas_sp.AAC.1